MAEIGNGMLIKRIYERMEKNANNHLRPLGLTISQVNVLYELLCAEGLQLTMKQLEHQLMIQASTNSGLITRLKAKGLVETSVDTDDSRVLVVHLTEEGKKRLFEAQKDVEKMENHLVSGMTDEEAVQFQELLKKALSAIA